MRLRRVPALLPLLVLSLSGCAPPSPARRPQAFAPIGAVHRFATPLPRDVRLASDADSWQALHLDVVQLALGGRFGSLDSLLDSLERRRPELRDGTLAEEHVYDWLAGAGLEPGAGQRARFVGAMRRWHEAEPGSEAAAAAYAGALTGLAWESLAASPAAGPAFDRRLDEAWSVLAPWQDAPGGGVGWTLAAFRIALGEGWPRGRVDQLRNHALDQRPDFERADALEAACLLPRFGGAPGEWQAFATAVAEDGPDGARRYARVAGELDELVDGLFADGRVSWALVDRGFQALEREHPDSVTLPSRHARLAFEAGERGALRALFARLGGRCDPGVWRSLQEYEAARRFAAGGPAQNGDAPA
ncbi:MAG TPA: hypothetical protein VGU27_10825 [Candidatus Eisenbacteria bacterium]|nr:hypothetical protein [Candidatus Eisenbacteria bacterium]